MTCYNFLDTSALLCNKMDTFEGEICISPFVLKELEDIKTRKDKDEAVKAKARKAVRDLCLNNNYIFVNFSQKKIDKKLKQKGLDAIMDHKILASVLLFKEKHPFDRVILTTSDYLLFLFAQETGLESFYLTKQPNHTYFGWNDYFPSEQTFSSLYTDNSKNVLGAEINEYCKIFNNNELTDILRWDGQYYQHLKWANFETPLREKIKPRNLEQKMMMDCLQNEKIPIKLFTGPFGTGKSFITMSWALDQLYKGRFKKIVYVFNHVQVSGTKDIGALPAGLEEKMAPWLAPIADILGGMDILKQLLEDGQIECLPLAVCRGRNLSDCCVIADEVENFDSKKNFQLLIGRIGEGSQLIFLGDEKQTDIYQKESLIGIQALIKGLKGNENFGHVHLIKTERSKIAALADKLDFIE